MRNQECYDKNGNFLGWFSRSIAVVGATFVKDNYKWYVLASQRGKGTPDKEYVGKWNLCCGYLDFDENGKKAIIRETKEETGVDISKDDVGLVSINTNPKKDKRQNVTLRYLTVLKKDKKFYEEQFSHKENEKDEVGEIKFIDIEDLDKYEWAFNHKNLISQIFNKHIDNN